MYSYSFLNAKHRERFHDAAKQYRLKGWGTDPWQHSFLFLVTADARVFELVESSRGQDDVWDLSGVRGFNSMSPREQTIVRLAFTLYGASGGQPVTVHELMVSLDDKWFRLSVAAMMIFRQVERVEAVKRPWDDIRGMSWPTM